MCIYVCMYIYIYIYIYTYNREALRFIYTSNDFWMGLKEPNHASGVHKGGFSKRAG